MGARICLLYDGFFSFAVVRQVFLLFILLCYMDDVATARFVLSLCPVGRFRSAGLFYCRLKSCLFQKYFWKFSKKRAESVLFAIVARDSFHLLTPFLWGCRVDFSLSANMTPETPDSARFFENFQKYF